MLYRYSEFEEDGKEFFNLNEAESFGISKFGVEKTLENVLAEIFVRNGIYMPIFQERPLQSEPDLVALDEHGNLILFELKRDYIDKKAALTIVFLVITPYGKIFLTTTLIKITRSIKIILRNCWTTTKSFSA